MKKIVALLLLLSSFQAKAQYWNEINSGTQGRLLSIDFANDRIGYAGGEGGLLLKTTDGGDTWVSIPTPSIIQTFLPKDISDLDFVNADTGYAITTYYDFPQYSGVLLKTIDGGANWVTIIGWGQPNGVKNVNPYSAYFFEEGNGFIAGSSRSFPDSGYAVNKISSDTPVSFADFQSSDDHFFRTIDFRNEQTGILAGNKGFIARTFDGGLTWDTLTCQATDTTINAIRFLNDSTIIAACDNSGGTLLISHDTGRTWQADFSSLTFDYPIMKSIAVSVKDSFIAVGSSTTQSGKGMIYWKGGFETVAHPLYAVAMLNDSTAYAVGDSGIIVTNKSTPPVTGIHNAALNENDFKVYPNPNAGNFIITSDQKHSITLFDITGKLIFEDKGLSDKHTVSLKGVASGIYLLKIHVGDKAIVKRITLER